MDERKHLIFIKGENKTRQIDWCYYDRQTQRYQVTFTGGKTYPYAYSSVKWLREPEALEPSLYKISKGDASCFGIRAIFVFQDKQAIRDRMKDEIFAKYGIPILRLPTNGGAEIQKIKVMLKNN